MEVLSAIDQALDRPDDIDLVNPPDPKKVPFNERDTFYVTKMDCKFFDDLTTYKTERVVAAYESDKQSRLVLLGLIKEDAAAEGEGTESTTTTEAPATGDASVTGTEGATNAGWVFELEAYHFHNGKPEYRNNGDEQDGFVLKRLIHRLEEGSVKLPVMNDKGEKELVEFTFKEMGISYPMLVGKGVLDERYSIPNPEYKPPAGGGLAGGMGGPGMGGPGMGGPGMGGPGMGGPGMGGPGMGGGSGMGSGMAGGQEKEDPDNPRRFAAPKHSFKIQFIWQERPLSVRMAAKKAKEEEALKAKEAEEGKPAEEQSGENVASL
jgi:hypothetical protein